MFLPADVSHMHEESMQISNNPAGSALFPGHYLTYGSLFGFLEQKSLMTNETFAFVALVSMRRPANRSMLTDWWQICLFKGWRDTDSHVLLQTTRDQCDAALHWSICSKNDLWISSSKYPFQLIVYGLQKHSLQILQTFAWFLKVKSFHAHVGEREVRIMSLTAPHTYLCL